MSAWCQCIIILMIWSMHRVAGFIDSSRQTSMTLMPVAFLYIPILSKDKHSGACSASVLKNPKDVQMILGALQFSLVIKPPIFLAPGTAGSWSSWTCATWWSLAAAGGYGGVPVEFDTSDPVQDLREHGTTAKGRPAMRGQPNKARSSAPAVLKNYYLQ
jgi:hypothetical protein